MADSPTSGFFVSDLHGQTERYRKLFEIIFKDPPSSVFIGGDFMPLSYGIDAAFPRGFIHDFMIPELASMKKRMGENYPRIFLIMGNDDIRAEEPAVLEVQNLGLLEYIHNRTVTVGGYSIYGYAFVPPTPFQLKDWERYDVSRFVDPGSISPEEGRYSVPVSDREKKYSTIKTDLENLTQERDLEKAIFLFHAPPYKTSLDRAALDNVKVDHVPLDVNTGSIAIRQFIETRQPLITLHGHIHESIRLTGRWLDKIGRTYLYGAAHDGPELALVSFDFEYPDLARRILI
ncbi:Calcineurin-like phosphoesterase [Candidatus Zixiibacteriota bacterium]|nr:Calcineurin-like phosphoesterase [candidate division Zixibacteria bacterium]